MRFWVTLCLLAVMGCGGSRDPDVNPQVFQTAERARAQREARQQAAWAELAVSILKTDRPDVSASAAVPFAVDIEAGGHKQNIDLMPLEAALSVRDANASAILRAHLQEAVAEFDQQRLTQMGFEGAKKLLSPHLMSTAEMAGSAVPHQPTALAGLVWIVVARWSGEHHTPVGEPLLAAWKVSIEQVRKAAMENLASTLDVSLIVTTPFGPAGKIGNLRPDANAAVILLPQFLELVRKTWDCRENLLVMVASRQDVRFIASGNPRLAALVCPAWHRHLSGLPAPLVTTLVLLRDDGLFPFVYQAPASSTKAATTAATTRPKPYIVH